MFSDHVVQANSLSSPSVLFLVGSWVIKACLSIPKSNELFNLWSVEESPRMRLGRLDWKSDAGTRKADWNQAGLPIRILGYKPRNGEIHRNTSNDGLNIQYCNTIQPKDGFTSNGIPELGWYLSASSIRPGWKLPKCIPKSSVMKSALAWHESWYIYIWYVYNILYICNYVYIYIYMYIIYIYTYANQGGAGATCFDHPAMWASWIQSPMTAGVLADGFQKCCGMLPSGNSRKNYWTWPIEIVDFPINNCDFP